MAADRPYDVFLSHNSLDKDAVEALARRLEDDAGIHPFLDKWHLIPGNPWQEELEGALDLHAPVPFSLALMEWAPGKMKKCASP